MFGGEVHHIGRKSGGSKYPELFSYTQWWMEHSLLPKDKFAVVHHSVKYLLYVFAKFTARSTILRQSVPVPSQNHALHFHTCDIRPLLRHFLNSLHAFHRIDIDYTIVSGYW